MLIINTYFLHLRMNINEVNKAITDYCTLLNDQLLKKNLDYNNSLHEPSRLFSKASITDGILCRIDDKISRIAKKGIDDKTEDSIDDLIGYLVHLKISLKNA